MKFSERNQIKQKYPARDTYEEAPERVRGLLDRLVHEGDVYGAYVRLCEVMGRMPDSNIWGASYASPEVRWMIERLEWWQVFDMLEEVAEGNSHLDQVVNEAFALSGLAYEMVDGSIYTLDEAGDLLEITGEESATVQRLAGKYSPARKQFEKALEGLHGRPMDLEKAISESVGALEGVARIITGQKDFGKAVDAALSGRAGAGALGASLKALYGYASQLPGARHGRHSEPDVTIADARVVVRMAGSAIAYLIDAAEQ